MTKEKVYTLLVKYKDMVDANEMPLLKEMLEEADEEAYERLMLIKIYDVNMVTMFSVLLGGFSGDRFYLGDTGLAVAKLFLGPLTCGIWNIVDIFICQKRARKKNLANILSVL